MREKLIIWVVLAGLIFSLSASALEYSPNPVVFSNISTDWTRTQTLDKFDPSLGVLTKVEVSADACASQLFILDSEDSEPQCWNVISNAMLTATMPDGTNLVLTLPEKINAFCLPADSDEGFISDYVGNDSFRFFIKECVDDEKVYNDLTNWIGPGTLDIKVVAKGSTNVDGSSSFDQKVRTFANETLRVTYYYEPCDDNNPCTNDTIVNNQCVNTSKVCDDKSACTTDSCDPATGACAYIPVACGDGNECTADTCDPILGCQHATIRCNDSNACTADTCDPVLGCQHAAISCDDSNACTADT